MGRLRSKRAKRLRSEQPGTSGNMSVVDACCDLCSAGIEDPFPPDIGLCDCPCSDLHPTESVCLIDAPARRYVRIELKKFGRPMLAQTLPVCLPCMHATARRHGPVGRIGSG